MATTTEKNAYAVLGLNKGSTIDDIKQAYVQLVKKFDPEKHTERFMEIQKAFDKLRDPAKRAREDVNTFNFVRGDFFFNPEEQNNAPDVQIEQAIKTLEQRKAANDAPAAEIDPKLCQGYMIRSWKKVQKKLWAEAIQDWQRVLKLDPTNRRAKNNLLYSFITLGYSYANHGLFDEAVDVWSKAGQMNPDDINVLHNLALACEKSGRIDDASRYWNETVKRWKVQLEREPDNDYLKSVIIEVLREHGEVMNAQPGSAPAATPGAAGAPATSHEPRAMGGPVNQRAATAAAGRGLNEYREILKLNPNDFEAQYKIANLLMQDHKWDEAIKELEEMRGKYPRNVEVLNLLGWALLNGGRHDDAFMIWRKGQAIDPKNQEVNASLIKAHMSMGRMLRDKGLYTPCLVHFKALTRYLPENDEVHFEIAKTYHLKGDERSAFQEYTRVLKLNPKHKEARNSLSTLKLRR